MRSLLLLTTLLTAVLAAPLPDHDHKYHINPCPDPASRPKRHEGVHIVDGALASTIDGFETLEKRAAHDLSDAKFAMGEWSKAFHEWLEYFGKWKEAWKGGGR